MILEVNGLNVCYGKKEIVHGASFGIEKGELVGIIGANGSGKTTLLKAVCNVLTHKGSCILNGMCTEELSPKKMASHCSYIPQRSGIEIDIGVLDVVLMGFNPKLGILEYPDSDMKKKAKDALRVVGLEERADDNYLTLSEGQKQLCILARTLVTTGNLLLLDEPESALDFRYRYRMLEIIRNWIGEEDRAALVTLHDPGLALRCCDRLLLMDNGDILDSISPGCDTTDRMEQALSHIYGAVSLTRVKDRLGMEQIVMLKEED